MKITEAEIFSRSDRVSGWFTQKNSDLINIQGAIPGLDLGFNTLSGKKETEANLSAVADHLKLDTSDFAFVKQVHGSRVLIVNDPGMKADADALITNRPGLTLAIQVADCAAILMADTVNGVVAAVHAGWRGAVSGVVKNAISHMTRDSGADADKISVYMSPAITVDHFEVGDEVASEFPERFVDYDSWDKPHVDLKAFLIRQLNEAGIGPDSIQVDSGCTWKEKNRYYSYRREGSGAGRMLGLIRLNY